MRRAHALLAPILVGLIAVPLSLVDRPPRAGLSTNRLVVISAADDPLEEGWTRSDTGEQSPQPGPDLIAGPHSGVFLRWAVASGSGTITGGAFSRDGVRWRRMRTIGDPVPNFWSFGGSIATSEDVAVSVDHYGDDSRYRRGMFPMTAVILRSTDGVAWKRVLTIPDAEFATVTHSDGRFLAHGQRIIRYGPMGRNQTEDAAWTSTDGVRWTAHGGIPSPAAWATTGRPSIEWRGRHWRLSELSGGELGNQPLGVEVVSTAEGVDEDVLWLGEDGFERTSGSTWSLAAGADRLVAIADYGYMTGDEPNRVREIDYVDGTVSEAWTTRDGMAWTRCSSTGVRFAEIAAVGDRFVAATDRGLLVSTDGCLWRKVGGSAPSDSLIAAAPFGDELIVIESHPTGIHTNKGEDLRYYAWTWKPSSRS